MTVTTVKADFAITNARLVDGSGEPSRPGGIAIAGERIVALGDLSQVDAQHTLDAGGKAIAPGFIDVHTHDDRALLADPLMTCKVSQGVTTVVTGNCGVSLAPLSIGKRPPSPLDLISESPDGFFARMQDYFAALDDAPPAVNAVAQVGHASLRAGVMDSLDRPATTTEIGAMRRLLEEGLEAGAIGMSTGLFYDPAKAAPTEEVIELARSLSQCGALHSTHMRDEAAGVHESLAETFRIGREADVPVIISHHKCAGKHNHGRSVETLSLIDKARRTQPIGLDAYPYVAASTSLANDLLYESSRVVVSWSQPYPEASGRDLSEIAADWGVGIDEAVRRLSPAGGIFFMMDEDDVQRILAFPETMIGSDGLPHDVHPHPRLWGTFPRVLGHYAREVHLFSLEEAVRKMTSLSADRFGLRDRGRLAVGAYADLVLFDPDKIADRATFEQPKTPAAGVSEVWVNGISVWRDGEHSGERPGKALRRAQA